MEADAQTLHADLQRIKKDIEVIKEALLYDGELTDWAKKQLARARAQKKETYTSLEDLRKEIEAQ